jgi:uridylate kinase
MEYKRILLKVSGEFLGGESKSSFDFPTIDRVCRQIEEAIRDGRQIAIVMGAGNFFRGREGVEEKMDRVVSDQVGMIGTIMNAIMLRERLKRIGIHAVAFSAIESGLIVEKYSPAKAIESLDSGNVALCAGGTGNPFFTTDTASVLRALELKCNIMFKATMVDGVYDKDPKKYPDAKRFERITYKEILDRELKVMDLPAVALAEIENMPIAVFDLSGEGMLARVGRGDLSGATIVTKVL